MFREKWRIHERARIAPVSRLASRFLDAIEQRSRVQPGFAEGYGPGAVLVRPDGFVAWRSDDGPSDGVLPAVLDRVLAR